MQGFDGLLDFRAFIPQKGVFENILVYSYAKTASRKPVPQNNREENRRLKRNWPIDPI
jgi:hypothetical protein